MYALFYLFLVIIALSKLHTSYAQESCPPLRFGERGPLNPSELVSQLTAPCRYDRWLRPDPSGEGKAVNVNVRVQLFFLGAISSQGLRFTAHTLIMYRWQDPRLSFNHHSLKQITNIKSNRSPALPITYQGALLSDKIWMPYPFIKNELDSFVLGPERKDVRITLHPDGTVQRSQRVKMTLSCMMALHKFPFDKQICSIFLQSWLYDKNDMYLNWEKYSPLSINPDLSLSEFRLTDVQVIDEESDLFHKQDGQAAFSDNMSDAIYFPAFRSYNQDIYNENKRNFSILEIRLSLSRITEHYVMHYYIPSILLVAISWITFWLDPNAIPGRTVLGTSTMLCLITLNLDTGNSLPKVSVFKVTEVWFVACSIFIVASLLEFAFVNTIWRRKSQVSLKKVTGKHIFKSTLNLSMAKRALSSEMLNIAERRQSWPKIDGPKTQSKDSGIFNTNRMLDPLQLFKSKSPSIKKNHSCSSLSGSGTEDEICQEIVINVPTMKPKSHTKMTPHEVARWIDIRSRVWFPVTFLVFNIFYWGFVWI